jgi:hypothetical protein
MYKKKLSNTKIKENIKNISQMGQHLYKVIFHTGTCALILLSVYPGNLIGLIFFGDDRTFPGSDKFHHFLSYFLVSGFGFLAYPEKNFFFKLLVFLLGLGFFLELFHIWIPNRYFEFLDMFSNFSGVFLALIATKVLKNVKF